MRLSVRDGKPMERGCQEGYAVGEISLHSELFSICFLPLLPALETRGMSAGFAANAFLPSD